MELHLLGEISEGHRLAAIASDFSFDGSIFATAGNYFIIFSIFEFSNYIFRC